MNKEKVFIAFFVIGFISIIVYAFLKITHSQYSDSFLIIGVVATIIYTVIALYEIHSSAKIDTSEKIMWMVGFLFINTVTALIYFLVGRKRIIKKGTD